ncbi:hypothetical protein HQ520_04245 [bacterium]|nr:hypothetical protein [bacterium]
MPFEQSEIVCLVLALIFLAPLVLLFRTVRAPHVRVLFLAMLFAVGATIFTVAENLYLPSVFNLLEHICYALSSATFAIGCWSLHAHVGKTQGEPE